MLPRPSAHDAGSAIWLAINATWGLSAMSDLHDLPTLAASIMGAARHYTSLNQIIEDVDVARIYTGFHYRSTLVRSNTLGIAVANWVNGNMMMVLSESPLGPDDEDNDGHYRGIPVQENYDLNNLENED